MLIKMMNRLLILASLLANQLDLDQMELLEPLKKQEILILKLDLPFNLNLALL